MDEIIFTDVTMNAGPEPVVADDELIEPLLDPLRRPLTSTSCPTWLASCTLESPGERVYWLAVDALLLCEALLDELLLGDVLDGEVLDGDVLDGDVLDGDVLDVSDEDPPLVTFVRMNVDALLADELGDVELGEVELGEVADVESDPLFTQPRSVNCPFSSPYDEDEEDGLVVVGLGVCGVVLWGDVLCANDMLAARIMPPAKNIGFFILLWSMVFLVWGVHDPDVQGIRHVIAP